MNRGPAQVVLVALLALAAGCLQSTPPPEPTHTFSDTFTSPANPIPFGPGHDHADPAQHRFARNAELVAIDDLRDYGWAENFVVGAHAVDLHDNLLAVGVNAGETDDGQQGFHLYDVSTNLTHISYYLAPQPVSGDRTIAFDEAGTTVYLGYEGAGVRPGVAAIDVSDPTNPVERAFWSDPQNYGAHTVGAATMDGVRYVFSIALGVNILRDDGDALTLVGKYVTNDQLSALDALGMLNTDDGADAAAVAQTYALRSLYGHDMSVYHDPITTKTFLLVAYAYDGLKILDLTIPSLPVLQARWMPPPDTAHKHYTHSVQAERGADGRLIVVVGSETFEPANQNIASPVWILDATAAVDDPVPLRTEPSHLSTWRNPGNAPAGNLGISVHFFRIVEGILYISHYHGGVWAVDLRTEAARATPEAFGYMMPVGPGAIRAPEGCCIGFSLDGVPMVFDVAAQPGGTVFAADLTQGVSRIQFHVPA